MAIENVIYQPNFDYHENPERIIATLVNGDIPGFSSEHIKLAKFNKSTELANHWREYSELYGVIGKASFTLEDIETKDRRLYPLKTGDRLLVPPRVALKIEAQEGTIIIACSEKLTSEE